jgi:hypothetical protein
MNWRDWMPVLVVTSCVGLPSCGFNVITHDERAAASSAQRFARSAFVEKAFRAAHDQLSPDARLSMSLEQLTATAGKMHPGAWPTDVAAVEFEPLPGRRAMNILLRGTAENEIFYYRLLMNGDASSGYTVAGLWRGNRPYPSKAKRPLR